MAKDKTKTEAAAAVDTAKPEKKPRRLRRKGKAADAATRQPGDGDSGKKRKKGRRKRQTGKRWKLIRLLVIIVVALIIIAGAAYVVVFNQFGVRDKIFDTISSLDPRERAYAKVLEQRSDKLDGREQDIIKDEEDLAQRKSELDTREDELDAESDRLEELREQLANQSLELTRREEESVPRYLQPMTDEELSDLKKLAKIYSSMNSEQAVEIMSSLYDVQDMVAIIYQMSNTNIAAILAAMDVSLAVEITEILLHE